MILSGAHIQPEPNKEKTVDDLVLTLGSSSAITVLLTYMGTIPKLSMELIPDMWKEKTDHIHFGTTGAGDSFNAGLITRFLDGSSDLDMLTFGNACGALSTLAAGGTRGKLTVTRNRSSGE
jgi:sugar/nucleoside kinase (ribokinase family)